VAMTAITTSNSSSVKPARPACVHSVFIRTSKGLSQNPATVQGDETELSMNETKIVLRFLLPTNQQPAGSVGPRMRSFHDPTSRFLARSTATLLLAAAADVKNVSEALCAFGRAFAEVALVQTEMLSESPSLGASNGYRLKRGAQQTLIVRMGATAGASITA
jgi:hypothetical protein